MYQDQQTFPYPQYTYPQYSDTISYQDDFLQGNHPISPPAACAYLDHSETTLRFAYPGMSPQYDCDDHKLDTAAMMPPLNSCTMNETWWTQSVSSSPAELSLSHDLQQGLPPSPPGDSLTIAPFSSPYSSNSSQQSPSIDASFDYYPPAMTSYMYPADPSMSPLTYESYVSSERRSSDLSSYCVDNCSCYSYYAPVTTTSTFNDTQQQPAPPAKSGLPRGSTNDIRPYPCYLCTRSFARKHDLQRHIRVHTGAKPYACPCCKKAFARTDALKRHLRMEETCRTSPEIQAMKNAGKRRYRNL